MNDKKERPIILNTDEVNAVLSGDKTQHRVLVLTDEQVCAGYEWTREADGDNAIFCKNTNSENDSYLLIPCPFGAIGDRLWAQEPTYTATDSLVQCKDSYTPSDLHLPWDDEHQEYTGPIGAEYLPRWASRLLLEITDVRIERAQDITVKDVFAMGCDRKNMSWHDINSTGCRLRNAFNWFKGYWDSIHGKGAWDRNWVWVIEFKKVTNNE